MYRIRQQDGRELEFPSIQSFSNAVREGVVAAEDEIFHRRAERWLPVREHPHFQKALAEAGPESSPAPAPPPSPIADVNLDAILALLDSPASPAPSRPAAEPDPLPVEEQDEESPEEREPADPESALGNIDDLPVLRASFEEEDGAVEAEPSTPSGRDGEPSAADAEGGDEGGDEVPIESLAPEGTEAASWEPGADDEPWQPEERSAPEADAQPAIAESAAATPEPVEPVDDEQEDEEEFSEDELFPTLDGGASEAAVESPEPIRPWEAAVAQPEPLKPEPLAPLPRDVGFTGPEMDLGSAQPAADPVSPPAMAPSEPLPVPTRHEPDGAAVADLDWASTVSGTFPVARGRNRLPLVAAAVVLVTLVTFFLLRGGDDGDVASEGLPAVAPNPAAAETVPQGASSGPLSGPTGEALVLQPDVPTGSAVSITPAPPVAIPDTARERVVPLNRPIVRSADGTGGVQLGQVNVGTFSGMKSHGDLMRFYNASYDQAQARLEADLVRAGFSRLFGAGTLTTSEGLRDGRRAIVTGRAALAAYRQREAEIEGAYRDSLAVMGRRLGLAPEVLAAWAPRPSRREREDAAAPIAPLLDQADGALEFLQGEIGHYRLQGTTLIFEREAAAQRFSQFRVSLERGVETLDQALITQRAAARALGSPGLPLEMTN